MKVIYCEATNFGSYPALHMNLSDIGLALVSGPTGAGKSTLMDVVCWTLYGQTAKGGNADEVRSWLSPHEMTLASARVETLQGTITVYRKRGKTNQNDLYWRDEKSDEAQRGKDLTETQKLLNQRLGADFDQYATGAYFHEFSPTSSFFVATAKTRRAIFEKVATLDLPIKIAEKTGEAKKQSAQALKETQSQIDTLNMRLSTLASSQERITRDYNLWGRNKSIRLEELFIKADTFEENKIRTIATATDLHTAWEASREKKIQEMIDTFMSEVCYTCKQILPSVSSALVNRSNNIEELKKTANPYEYQLARAKDSENHYVAQLEEEEKKTNPFVLSGNENTQDYYSTAEALKVSEQEKKELDKHFSALDTLQDLSFVLRAALLTRAVQDIQYITNSLLIQYFDSEIKVTFELEGSDSLKVGIQKSGYECVYKQLSKGQRGLLKLCFSVAMMAASANSAGIHFDVLMFDESLDGMDTGMKLKAFRLFESLAKHHSSVLVIDHCEELKELFQTKFAVSMEADASVINEL